MFHFVQIFYNKNQTQIKPSFLLAFALLTLDVVLSPLTNEFVKSNFFSVVQVHTIIETDSLFATESHLQSSAILAHRCLFRVVKVITRNRREQIVMNL